jgi:hypothetical protein
MTESIEIVITGLDPVIHLLRKNFLRRLMDARIKSGHDGCVLWSTPFSETVIASEAKQSMAQQERKSGLLRFARNDEVSGYDFALATRSVRGVDEASAPWRAWGTPDAQCTRGLVCNDSGRTHTSNNEYIGITRHSRTQWF